MSSYRFKKNISCIKKSTNYSTLITDVLKTSSSNVRRLAAMFVQIVQMKVSSKHHFKF